MGDFHFFRRKPEGPSGPPEDRRRKNWKTEFPVDGNFGPELVPDAPYYTSNLAYPDFAPNLWPKEPTRLRAAMLSYYDGMLRLAMVLSEAYAIALNLPEHFFTKR